jgi:hypothetical protein
MRIELRQVGAREEARMVGGLGPCGRNLCCTLFPGDDDPVSIRMAKEQNLPLNPMKISGLCGRLMCCLKYEQEQYVSFRKEAPPRGTSISTPSGDAVIVGYNVPRDAITVKHEDGSFSDIRLSGCKCSEGGGFVVVPEDDTSLDMGPEEVPDLAGLSTRECVPEALAVVEAEVVRGEDGEVVEVTATETSRRGRGRRGRRGGKRRAKTQETGGKDDRSAEIDSGADSGEERSGSRRRGHKPPRHSHGGQEQSSGQDAASGKGNSTGQGGAGGSSSSRRNKRPSGGDSSRGGGGTGQGGRKSAETGGSGTTASDRVAGTGGANRDRFSDEERPGT